MAIALIHGSSAGPATSDQGTNANPSAAELVALSSEMADVAHQTGDAMLLIAAARLRLSALGTKGRDEADAWLNSARRLSRGDPLAARMIAEAENLATRGRDPGPATLIRQARSGEIVSEQVTFRRGTPAIVLAEGQSGTALLMQVFATGSASPVCVDQAGMRRAMCRWVPASDQPYRIDVTSSRPGHLLIVTN